jgi:hypothetical protein
MLHGLPGHFVTPAAPAAITAPVAIGLAALFLLRARDGTIDPTAAYCEWLARNVIGPEPTAVGRVPPVRVPGLRQRAVTWVRSALRSSLPTLVSGIASRIVTSRVYLFVASLPLAKLDHLLRCRLAARPQRHERHDLLAEPLVRSADHASHRHGRVLKQDVLDVARVDVEPSPDDEVLLAVDYV